MPRFTLPGAKELSCADSEGRAFQFKFPYETESPTEIALLLKHGAVEAPAPKPPTEPKPAEPKAEKKAGGDV